MKGSAYITLAPHLPYICHKWRNVAVALFVRHWQKPFYYWDIALLLHFKIIVKV